MAETTNEMNLPIISAPALGITGDVTATAVPPSSAYDFADDIAIGSPTSLHQAADITVYANSINQVSYGPGDSPIVAFDIVFSVGINCGDSTKTYQVVKRIGIDKCKLAENAECSTPVSIVESKNSLQEDAVATRKRFRKLAGLE